MHALCLVCDRELDRGTDDALLRAFKLPRSFTQPNEMMDEKMAWVGQSGVG